MEIKIANTSKTNNGYQEKDKPKPPKKKGTKNGTKTFKEYLEELK